MVAGIGLSIACSPAPSQPLGPSEKPTQTSADRPPSEPPAKIHAYAHSALGSNVCVQTRQPDELALPTLLGSLLSRGTGGLNGTTVALAQHRNLLWIEERTPRTEKRVLVHGEVCLRQGYLEHLLSNKTAEKEHESVIVADINAIYIHLGLIGIGAKQGKPVQFFDEMMQPAFKPPTGEKIAIHLRYEEKGKEVLVPAQKWVRDSKAKKELQYDWVFAGSKIFADPEGKQPPYYGANQGRVICTSNFNVALLDIPVASSDKNDEGLQFEANTDQIPPVRTPVTLILEKKSELSLVP
jgi:hypothetical protein